VDAQGPAAATHRDGRLVVCRFASDAVQDANRQSEGALDEVRASDRGASPAPRITDVVSVQDVEAEALHLILVRRLDYRPQPAPPVGRVAVFSEPAYAVFRTERVQLATPAYYWEQEGLKPGIGDVHDGTLTKDSIRWARTVVPGGTVTGSSVSFASSREPWVYCASHYRWDRGLRRLKNHFAEEYDYTAAARIRDPNAFAIWLGIDFALNLDKATDVKPSWHDESGSAGSSHNASRFQGSGQFDTVVHICHGPVHYEDSSGYVATRDAWFDPHGGPRACLTKKKPFANQREYRFAVSTAGDPGKPRHYIPVSPELRELTSAL